MAASLTCLGKECPIEKRRRMIQRGRNPKSKDTPLKGKLIPQCYLIINPVNSLTMCRGAIQLFLYQHFRN